MGGKEGCACGRNALPVGCGGTPYCRESGDYSVASQLQEVLTCNGLQ